MRALYLFATLILRIAGQKYEGDYSPLLDVSYSFMPLFIRPPQQNTSPSNPGLYLRLMPTGLAYMREIGMKVVNEQVLKMALPTIREQIENGEVGSLLL